MPHHLGNLPHWKRRVNLGQPLFLKQSFSYFTWLCLTSCFFSLSPLTMRGENQCLDSWRPTPLPSHPAPSWLPASWCYCYCWWHLQLNGSDPPAVICWTAAVPYSAVDIINDRIDSQFQNKFHKEDKTYLHGEWWSLQNTGWSNLTYQTSSRNTTPGDHDKITHNKTT